MEDPPQPRCGDLYPPSPARQLTRADTKRNATRQHKESGQAVSAVSAATPTTTHATPANWTRLSLSEKST